MKMLARIFIPTDNVSVSLFNYSQNLAMREDLTHSSIMICMLDLNVRFLGKMISSFPKE